LDLQASKEQGGRLRPVQSHCVHSLTHTSLGRFIACQGCHADLDDLKHHYEGTRDRLDTSQSYSVESLRLAGMNDFLNQIALSEGHRYTLCR
jgi:hypothetical protein